MALMSGIGTRATLKRGAKPVRLCPCSSDVNLFSYGEGIIDFNPEIPDGALDLRMSQHQLHGTQIAGQGRRPPPGATAVSQDRIITQLGTGRGRLPIRLRCCLPP